MRGRLTAVAAILVTVGLGAHAGAASAKSIVVGDSLTTAFTNGAVIPNGAVINLTIGPDSVASPVSGTVTSWRGFGLNGTYSVFVARPAGSAYTNVIETPPAQVSAPGASPDQQASLPIEKGDYVGWAVVSGSNLPTMPVGGSAANYFSPFPAGQTLPPSLTGSAYYVYNFTVRFCEVPEVSLLREAEARAALAAADCAVGAISKPKGKKKRKKAKFVRAQSVPAGTQISDTAPVGLTLGKKPKKKKGGKGNKK
jgi:hypothetical protein